MSLQVQQATRSKTGLLARITAERTRLLAAELKLYKSSFVPDQNSVIADFNAAEADFTGYATQVLVWSAAGLASDDSYQSESSNAFYQATDALAPNEIGGCWLETGAGELVEFFPFNPVIPMTQALAALNIDVILREPSPDYMQANW